MHKQDHKRITLGWRERISLNELGIPSVIAKVDTGAKTCALHTFYIDPFERDDEPWIRFGVHPARNSVKKSIHCEARVTDQRDVWDSGGHKEFRYVIETALTVGSSVYPAEITLTSRDNMRYRMLLGRNALKGRFLVDAAQSYCLKKMVLT